MFSFFKKSKQLPTLAIDLDGVLHDYNSVLNAGIMGDPIKGSKEAMDFLYKKGYTLVIYSIKADTKYGEKKVSEWLNQHEIPYHDISVSRPAAALYLDDKGLQFKNWKQAIRDIDKRISMIIK